MTQDFLDYDTKEGYKSLINLYTAWAKKQLEDNGYYVENTDKGGLTFSMTNRVKGLEGFYCELTREELVYQCDNSDNEKLKEIETEMFEKKNS